jgi:membrane peptidoglycan carboxypeptidase
MEPRVVRAIYQNERRIAVRPKPVRRIISSETASTLTGIMEQVVVRGTAKRAQIEGYPIAGKTGTASKLVNGHYSHSDYNASFVGFMPSRNPVFAMIVVVDSPHGSNGTHGGSVAAPIWQRIAASAVQYLGIPQTATDGTSLLVRRDVTPADGESGPTSVSTERRPDQTPVVDTQPGTVPDLTGLSARDVLRRLRNTNVTPRLSGDGFVVEQDPPAGTPIGPNTVCRLTLERSPVRRPAAAIQP